MVSAKERIRDTFYMEMWDKYEIEKAEVISILQEAGFEDSFDVAKLTEYEEAVKKSQMMKRIKKNMVPFPRTQCPYPDCDGEKITFRRSGNTMWFCSEGGNTHYVRWRSARAKCLMDKVPLEKMDEAMEAFIKNYEEKYGNENSKQTA